MHGAAQRKGLNTDGSPVISKCELKGSINTKNPQQHHLISNFKFLITCLQVL